MYKRILVPLDGSEHAESALPLACTLASINNAEITLLRVVEYPYGVHSTNDSYTLTNPWPAEKMQTEKESFRGEVEDYLKRHASSVEPTVSKVFIEVQECPVVDAILSTIEKLEIDLIVMSTVGQDCSPWMTGAITNRLLREAEVPIILMRKGIGGSLPDVSPQHRISFQKDIRNHADSLSYQ
jgi:nucleotide-binding universal stress UspA family protein